MKRDTSKFRTHSNLNEEICISPRVVVEIENSVIACEIKKIEFKIESLLSSSWSLMSFFKRFVDFIQEASLSVC